VVSVTSLRGGGKQSPHPKQFGRWKASTVRGPEGAAKVGAKQHTQVWNGKKSLVKVRGAATSERVQNMAQKEYAVSRTQKFFKKKTHRWSISERVNVSQ